MGSCMSVRANEKLLKRKKENNNNNNPPTSNPNSTNPRVPHVSALNVLKQPSGDDIRSRYEFEKEVGRGEFGVTYACRDLTTGERVACKRISKSRLRREVDVDDVRREVEIMKHLPYHPNIVTYKDVYEDKESIYLVMELCEGGELFDRIVARGHYTERAAALATKTIIQIIQVCHQHGVIHRDLKPENFLYASSSECAALKAIDFGLSIFFTPGQHFREIVGSPYYMAPEVLKRNYGEEIDIWSAGVILYILLCGVPPFWAETEEGIAHAIVCGKIDFNRDPWPKISQDAKNLVLGMLEQNPYNRMTIKEVLENHWIQNANCVPNISLGADVTTRIKQFSLMNKFKKKVIRMVAENLPSEQVEGIKQMFHMMDKDKNGNLSFEELKDGLNTMGQSIPDTDVRMLIDAADVDGNGGLNCEEFLTIAVHIKRVSNEDQLRQAFKYFDKNESGYIEFEELRESLFDDHHLSNNNEKMIHDIIFDADLDKDGRISYQEFKLMMTTGMDWKMASRQYSRVMLNALSMKLFNDKSFQLNN